MTDRSFRPVRNTHAGAWPIRQQGRRPCSSMRYGASACAATDDECAESYAGGRSIDRNRDMRSAIRRQLLPMVELRQIVRTHQPHEMNARTCEPAAQGVEIVSYSVAGADDSFETADIDAGIDGDHRARPRSRGRRVRAKLAVFLQWISRRDQPPDPIQLQTLHREQADGAMGFMRRIERAAEQADAHPRCRGRDRLRHAPRHHEFVAQCPRPASCLTAASARCRERDI